MKKMTSFEITMELVNAGCDIRKLDPDIIKLIEAAGSEHQEKPQHKQENTSMNIYGELALAASMIGTTHNDRNFETDVERVMKAIYSHDNEAIKRDFHRWIENDKSEAYMKLASLIASLD